jgi:hypothetical protein
VVRIWSAVYVQVNGWQRWFLAAGEGATADRLTGDDPDEDLGHGCRIEWHASLMHLAPWARNGVLGVEDAD